MGGRRREIVFTQLREKTWRRKNPGGDRVKTAAKPRRSDNELSHGSKP
jgi:hypothetical protein